MNTKKIHPFGITQFTSGGTFLGSVFRSAQFLDVLQPLVRDLGIGQAQRVEFRQARQVLEAVVGDFGL